MKVREITQDYRLDLFLIQEYGVYNEYLKSVICYFNPRIELLNLVKGTKLLVPTRAELSQLKKVRGQYDFVRN